MAFNPKEMSVIAYANGFTLWHYKSDDTIEQISAEKYFPYGFIQLAATGDIMIVNAGDGTCIKQVDIISAHEMKLKQLNNQTKG